MMTITGTTTGKSTKKEEIKLVKSDLSDLKQLYENLSKENKKIIKEKRELEADLLIKQNLLKELNEKLNSSDIEKIVLERVIIELKEVIDIILKK